VGVLVATDVRALQPRWHPCRSDSLTSFLLCYNVRSRRVGWTSPKSST
jgi:hypothetical protein